jgi:hypothetical protein
MTRIAIAAAFGLLVGTSGAVAKPPLREVPEIADGIFTIVTANEIRRHCDDISGRMTKGIGKARRLRARANDLGYADSEIRAVLNSDQEKARMIQRGRKYMASKGLDYDHPGDLCRLGHMEIKTNSAIGALLRAK